MPIRPPPRTYTCPACHWSKTVAPLSDALSPGEHLRACPACGHSPLTSQKASAVDAALAQVSQSIDRFLR